MIQTSLAWKEYSRNKGTFHIKATLHKWTTYMELTDEDFMHGSVSITDSISGMGEFNVGSVIANTFEGTLNNFSGKFNDVQFGGAKLTIWFGAELQGAEPVVIQSGYIGSIDGKEYADPTRIRTGYIEVYPNTEYTIKFPPSMSVSHTLAEYEYDSTGSFVYGWEFGGTGDAIFTTTADTHYIRLGFDANYGTVYKNDFGIYEGSMLIWGSGEEWIQRGVYNLEKPRSLGSTIQIIGYDNLVKLDRYYTGKTNTPANAFDKTKITENMVMARYGSPYAETGKFYSDYIPIPTEGIYYTNFTDYVLMYGVTGRFMGYLDFIGGAVNIPSGVAYVICNGTMADVNSYYFNSTFSDITIPQSVSDFVPLLCSLCNAEFDSSTASNLYRVVPYQIPPFEFDGNTTCRDVLSWIAQISGVYFRAAPNGKIQCLRFDLHKWEKLTSYDGGVFDPWHDTGDDLYDPDARIPQHIFDPETATVINGAGRFVSGFIAVESNTQYFMSLPPLGVYFFASNTVESYAQQLTLDSATRSFVAPSNGYIRFNGAEAGASSYHLYKADGISISGGTTNPWTNADEYDGGSTGGSQYSIENIKSLDIYYEDITVTGVRAFAIDTVGDIDPILADSPYADVNYEEQGTYDYMLEIADNKMISFLFTSTYPYAVALDVYRLINGFTMRPFTAQTIGDPSIEAGDIVALTDYRGVERISIITDLTYVLNSNERLECNAKSPEEMNSQRIRV